MSDSRRFQYETCCVQSTYELISDMQHQSKEITRRTFLQHVSREALWELEKAFGYDRHHKQGLTMARDWHVSYHKSVYGGKPCYYFDHSRIEYIFTEAS